MQHLRIISDLHLDFDARALHNTRLADPGFDARVEQEGDMAFLWFPPLMLGDEETTLILAGDLWTDRKFLRRRFSDGESWLKKISKRFKYVVFVLGNHDFWGTNLTIEPHAVRLELQAQGIGNAFIIEKEPVILDQVKFLGGVLWTDYDHNNPQVVSVAPFVMSNDHSRIRVGEKYRKLQVADLQAEHERTKTSIFTNAKKDNPEQRVVVVTHMAPSSKSIHPYYHNSDTSNFYYYSDLSPEICYTEHDIELWFHGHTHSPMDYMMYKTRVICNPRGYRDYESTGFNPELRIDL